jgi:DNA-binding NtrC family response regulator
VFLDEVGELSAAVQTKLLRALETRRITRVGATRERDVDIRIVAATHRDLDEESQAGRFRRDLWFRLNAACVILPPLRDRPREVVLLARSFVDSACAHAGRPPVPISAAAMHALARHAWPGNVRELKNALEFAVAAGIDGELQPWHLPRALARSEQPAEPEPIPAQTQPNQLRPIAEEVRELEERRMREALEATGGNQTRAAALIGMPLRTFVTKGKQFGLAGKRR